MLSVGADRYDGRSPYVGQIRSCGWWEGGSDGRELCAAGSFFLTSCTKCQSVRIVKHNGCTN